MRAAVLGNGQLYLGWDSSLRLREMFWPRVGLLNHLQENGDNRLVLWYDGHAYDLLTDEFVSRGRYLPGMGFEWTARHRHVSIEVTVHDWVDPYRPVWARAVQLSLPPGDRPVPAALYSVQAYAIGENTIGEQGAFDADRGRLYHFKGALWIAIELKETGRDETPPAPVAASLIGAVAKIRDGGVRFSHSDGAVHGPQVDHGLIQSAIGVLWAETRVGKAEYLVGFGRDRQEADAMLDEAGGVDLVAARSRRYWAALSGPGAVSVKALAAHCDRGGGVLASCDTDVLGDYRDHYRYVWPRDAAMCVSALLRSGLPEYARRYISFCCEAISEEGFFHQRYRSDGTRGSGWHPWGLPQGDLPVQEDETALCLVSAGEYLEATGDLDCLHEAYVPFIRKAARFVLDYTTEGGALVRPSYDVWEERRGTFAFTQAACVAGLEAASSIARALGREPDCQDFRDSAGRLLSGLMLHLSDDERGYCRGITGISDEHSDFDKDWTDDASLFLIPLLLLPRGRAGLPGTRNADLVAAAWKRSALTWERLKESLAVSIPGTEVPGYARYPGDWYFRPDGAHGRPGNPWLVTTAWFALSGATLGLLSAGELKKYLSWFQAVTPKTGLMPEQLSCLSGEPLSASPLAWSHAMYLDLLSAAKQARDLSSSANLPHTTRWTGQNNRDTLLEVVFLDERIWNGPSPALKGGAEEIGYRGILVRHGADKVYLHYGSDGWKNPKTVPMNRRPDGSFSCHIVCDGDKSIEFCFKDSADHWDNNSGHNWNVPVTRK